jgi:hypothetical protein
MAKYLDDSDTYFERRAEPDVQVTAVQARQGRLGRPVLTVLIASLVLVALAWAAVEFWGVSIAPRDPAVDPATTSSTTAEPLAGKNTFDDNPPADAQVEPVPSVKQPSKM